MNPPASVDAIQRSHDGTPGPYGIAEPCERCGAGRGDPCLHLVTGEVNETMHEGRWTDQRPWQRAEVVRILRREAAYGVPGAADALAHLERWEPDDRRIARLAGHVVHHVASHRVDATACGRDPYGTARSNALEHVTCPDCSWHLREAALPNPVGGSLP